MTKFLISFIFFALHYALWLGEREGRFIHCFNKNVFKNTADFILKISLHVYQIFCNIQSLYKENNAGLIKHLKHRFITQYSSYYNLSTSSIISCMQKEFIYNNGNYAFLKISNSFDGWIITKKWSFSPLFSSSFSFFCCNIYKLNAFFCQSIKLCSNICSS